MNDQDKQPGRVRRVGKKDQKEELKSSGPLFPPAAPPPAPPPSPPEPPAASEPPADPRATAERWPPLPTSTDWQPAAPPRPPRAKRSAPPPKKSNTLWQNIVALIFLAATLGVIVLGVMIYRDPYIPINVFAPPTEPPIPVTATPGPTERPTSGPTPTFTPLPADALTALAPAETTETP